MGGVAGVAVVALLASQGRAADHSDSPTLIRSPRADIGDLHAWMRGTETKIICRFASNSSIQPTRDYGTGDLRTTAGLTAMQGKVRVSPAAHDDFKDTSPFHGPPVP
jgi:hypothetical protein